jgi:hypothetical protein
MNFLLLFRFESLTPKNIWTKQLILFRTSVNIGYPGVRMEKEGSGDWQVWQGLRNKKMSNG